MTDMNETGIMLAETAGHKEKEFVWSESDYPYTDNSYKISVLKIQGKWFFEQTIAKDGILHSVTRFDMGDIDRQGMLNRNSALYFVSILMRELSDDNPHATVDEFVSAGAAHPLTGGVSIDVDGTVRCICEAFTKAELEVEAQHIIDDRKEQAFLHGLREFAYNHEHGSVFLVAETAEDKAQFALMRPVEPRNDMDLIIEVLLRAKRGSAKYLRPQGAFHLSKSPRFDYDSRTLTGVSEYIGFEGGLHCHSDIWNARAIMRRLPDEDVTKEDVSHHINMALSELSDETPEPTSSL